MSNTLIEAILRSEKIFVPYETRGHNRQVSNIVVMSAGAYASFNFIDHPNIYLGPVEILESDLSSDTIKAGIAQLPTESATIARVNIICSGVLIDGKYESVIEGIDLCETSGRTLRLRREGADYPYGLVLEL